MLSWLEIDLGIIANNIRVISGEIDSATKIMAMVKANAYGHGLIEVGRAAWTSGAEYLAVDNLEEAIALKLSKIKVPILMLGYVEPKDLERAIQLGIRLTVFDKEQVFPLQKESKRLCRPLKVHIKIDTGLHRLGIEPGQIFEVLASLAESPYISVEFLCSHFGEVSNIAASRLQVGVIQSLLFDLQRKNMPLLPVHLANSEAIFTLQESHFEMVRPGLAIYGLGNFSPQLKPALAFKTKIAQIRRIRPGEAIGYKFTYKASRSEEIAVLPVGYSQGYSRAFSNKAQVLFRGRRCPVRGLICMGMTMIEVTGLKAKVGDTITLIGEDRDDKIEVEELAKLAQTNPHEIVARLPKDLPRLYKE